MGTIVRLIYLVVFFLVSLSVFSQTFDDKIVTTSDTIYCRIISISPSQLTYLIQGKNKINTIEANTLSDFILSENSNPTLINNLEENTMNMSEADYVKENEKTIENAEYLSLAGDELQKFGKFYFGGFIGVVTGYVLVFSAYTSQTIGPIIVGSLMAVGGLTTMIISHLKIIKAGKYLKMASKK